MTMSLKGKKVILFTTLQHHIKRLFPVRKLLMENGAEVQLITTYNTTGTGRYSISFEAPLQELGETYTHAYDYLNESIIQCINSTLTQLYREAVEFLDHPRCLFSVVPHSRIFDALRETVEHYYLFQACMQKEKPDLVCALHEGNFWGKILFHAAASHNIPSISFQEGLWYENDVFFWKVYRHMADYSNIFVWGQQALGIGKAAGATIEHFNLIGNLEYDPIINRVPDENKRSRTRERLNIAPGEYVVGLFPAFLKDRDYYDLNDAIAFLYDRFFSRHKNYKLVLKLHPLDGGFQLASRFSQSTAVIELRNDDPLEIMDICHAVIPVDSTIGVEAHLLRKPVFELHHIKMHYRHSLVDQGAAVPIAGDGWPETLKKFCETGVSDEYRLNSQKYMHRMLANYTNDAKTLFLRRIHQLLDPKNPGSKRINKL